MRQNKCSLAALAIALTAVFFMISSSFASPKTVSLLANANKLAIEAQGTKGGLEQGQKFDGAVMAYREVNKADDKSPEAAQAQLAIGKIQAGVPVDSTPDQPFKKVYNSHTTQNFLWVWPRKVQNQDDYAARDTFRTIVQSFDRPRGDLVSDYGADGAEKVLGAVEQAKKYDKLLADRIDSGNKGKWQYKVMDTLVALTGRRPAISYWFAMVLLAVGVKLLISPLTKMQFKSMKEMQKVQPLLKQISEKYKGDQGEIGRRQMELYKEHGVNPFAGCLPLLVQMPVLWAVYGIIRTYEIQFAHGTFLWIGTASFVHKWAMHLSGGKPVWLTAGNLAEPDLILLVLYTGSMILSQKMTVVDPSQAEQQKMMSIMMPVMFFFLIGWLPSAFVLYWLVFNILQTWQQYNILKGGNDSGALAQATEAAAPIPAQAGRAARRRRRRR